MEPDRTARVMKWREIDHTFHGLTAEVKDPRTTGKRERPVMGRIRCEAEGVVPCLVDGSERIHMFAWWFVADIID